MTTGTLTKSGAVRGALAGKTEPYNYAEVQKAAGKLFGGKVDMPTVYNVVADVRRKKKAGKQTAASNSNGATVQTPQWSVSVSVSPSDTTPTSYNAEELQQAKRLLLASRDRQRALTVLGVVADLEGIKLEK